MYRILAAALLAALALAPAASAKEVEQVTACGADGCRTAKSPPPDVYALMPPQREAREAPFYRLKLDFGDGSGEVVHTLEVPYVPETGMIADEEQSPYWLSADPKTRKMADRLVRGLEPYPAAKLPAEARTDRPVEARVDEAVMAPPQPPGDSGGGTPWWPFAAGAAALLALVLTLARRRGASRAARSASPPPSPARG